LTAAVLAIRQNKVIRAYRDAGATAEERARTPEDLGLRSGSFPVRSLVSHGALKPAEKDRYWLDERAADAFLVRRRTIMLVLLAIGIGVALVLALT